METSDKSNAEYNKNQMQSLEKKTRTKRVKPEKPEKVYKVEIIYNPITEEEARIKRAIIEGIIKKTYLK